MCKEKIKIADFSNFTTSPGKTFDTVYPRWSQEFFDGKTQNIFVNKY
jgi:hypothetical protein